LHFLEVQPTHHTPIVSLRKSVALMHIALNRIMGVDRGKKGGLSPMALSIVYLSYYKEIKMSDISNTFGICKSTATDYVDNLEKKGYISRMKGDSDKRDIFLVPTEMGKQWVLQREQQAFAYLQECLSRLTAQEQDQFVHLFFKFVGNDETIPYEILIEALMKSPLSIDAGNESGQSHKSTGSKQRHNKDAKQT